MRVAGILYSIMIDDAIIVSARPAMADSKRIGLLVPSSNVVMEVEFYRSLPNGVTVHTSHIPRSNQAIDSDAMAANQRQRDRRGRIAAAGRAGPRGARAYGIELRRRHRRRHRDRAHDRRSGGRSRHDRRRGCGALPALGRRAAALACSTVSARDDANSADFMIAHGFEVLSVECLGVDQATQLKKVPAEAMCELGARAAARGNADALFVSGTGVHTMEVIGALERAIGKPVITANLAALWGALHRIGRADAFSFGESRLSEWQRDLAGNGFPRTRE
jgi:maleate cis-trans isomerase